MRTKVVVLKPLALLLFAKVGGLGFRASVVGL